MSMPIDRSLMPTSGEIREFVDEYNRLWCSDIEGVKIKECKDFKLPLSDASLDVKGCYIIYTEAGHVTYIGMSDRSVRERLRKHLSPAVQKCQFWRTWPGATFEIATVRFDWEPAALEAFLIHSVNNFAECKNKR